MLFNFIYKIPEYILAAYIFFLALILAIFHTFSFVLLRFIISIPLIAYTVFRMILNFCLQITSLTLSVLDLTFAKIEKTLFMKATALRINYHSLGSNPSAYGFIFIKNCPYYFIKILHVTVIIFALLPINIVSKTSAFLAHRVNLPTAKTLMEYIKVQTKNLFCNVLGHRFTLDVCIGFMLFDLFAALDMKITIPLKQMQSTLESYQRHGEKQTNTYTAKVNFRKTAYTLQKVINFIKEFITTLTSKINFFLFTTILGSSAILSFLILSPTLFYSDNLTLFYIFNFKKPFEEFTICFCAPFIAALSFIFGCYDFVKSEEIQPKNASVLYMSFTAIEYMFIRTMDTLSEIISIPFRWIEQAFTTLSQLFNDKAFDYRESEDSIDKFLKDIQSHKSNCVNTNDFSPHKAYSKNDKDRNQLFEKDIEVADELILGFRVNGEKYKFPYLNPVLAQVLAEAKSVQSNTEQHVHAKKI